MTSAAARGAGRMLAWRVHAYGGHLRLERARLPALRAPDQLLVRVRAASINPLDPAMAAGYGARVLRWLRAADGGPADGGLELPLVCGRDFAGTVVRAGPHARLRVGARVWGVLPPHHPGAHAQYALVRDRWAGPAPSALDELACGGAPYAGLTACAAVRAAGAGAGPGARVLVLGLGGVGQAAVQVLAARGARVAVSCAPEQAELARELGALEVVPRAREPGQARYAAVLDCAGLGGASRWSERGARYVTLSSPLLRETDARGLGAGGAVAALHLLAQNARAGWACPPAVRWAYFAARADDLEQLRRLAERGRFRVVVSRVYPWWEARAAYERAAGGAEPARGKLLLDWTLPAPDPLPADTC